MSEARPTHWAATKKDRKNGHFIVAWSLAWVLLFFAADLAIEKGWIGDGAPAIVATIAVTLLGLRVLLAFRGFLRDADELVRKIHMDALALAFGVGVVSSFGYALLESAEIVTAVQALNVVAVMMMTYVVSVFVGLRRYS